MIGIYTRLIELGIVIVVGITIWLANKIKSAIEFRRWKQEWINNSFEYEGARYSKKYFCISPNGKLTHIL